MNRKEVWESVVDAIEHRMTKTEFEKGEFRVEVNSKMGTITIIGPAPTRYAMTLMDVTGSHLEGGANPGDDIHVVLERRTESLRAYH